MQKKSSAQHRAVGDAHRSSAAQSAVRPGKDAREPKEPKEPKLAGPPPSRGSGEMAIGEMTLGGHVDRGLTLAALYDTGVLGRLRLEVRMRLFADLTQSLAWLHANPRLMAAHPHLVVAPSTVVIGLDGVARVDVRAAKKKESEGRPFEVDYVAPEVLAGDPSADLRADVYSVGALGWEALAGKRLGDAGAAASGERPVGGDASDPDLPLALGGRPERERLRRKPEPRSDATPSGTLGRPQPPAVTLPDEARWATPLAELVLQALASEPGARPPDCRPLLAALELIVDHLATTQEIAEVVQGISRVDTLCMPEPTLPDVDAACQAESGAQLGFMDRLPCAGAAPESCAQRQVPAVHRVEAAPSAPVEETPVPPTAPSAVEPPPSAAAGRHRVWFIAGMLWLAVLSVVAGYVATMLAR